MPVLTQVIFLVISFQDKYKDAELTTNWFFTEGGPGSQASVELADMHKFADGYLTSTEVLVAFSGDGSGRARTVDLISSVAISEHDKEMSRFGTGIYDDISAVKSRLDKLAASATLSEFLKKSREPFGDDDLQALLERTQTDDGNEAYLC